LKVEKEEIAKLSTVHQRILVKMRKTDKEVDELVKLNMGNSKFRDELIEHFLKPMEV
jgi:hypothetical protein